MSTPTHSVAERWLDDRAAPPGSTVWIVWAPNGDGIDIRAIVATYGDVEEFRKQQADEWLRCSEWRVLGAGWPSEAR